MTGRVIHHSEPVEFHKALPGAKSVVIWKRDDTPAAKPKNIPNAKRETTMVDYSNDISRGPFYSMIDRQARARQAITGESYEKAFTECYTAPENIAIRDNLQYEHIAKSHDVTYGTGLSSIPVQKSAPYDPLQKSAELAEIRCPAHARLHSLAIDHQRAHPGQSYASAYAYLYNNNTSLRDAVKAEHLSATMSRHAEGAVDKAAAPMDAPDPLGSAHDEMEDLVAAYMATHPKATREQAFTAVYIDAANAPLKARFDAEAAAFSYSARGHSSPLQHAPNIGRSGAKPRGYAGG
jgi:hypothetical protein